MIYANEIKTFDVSGLWQFQKGLIKSKCPLSDK